MRPRLNAITAAGVLLLTLSGCAADLHGERGPVNRGVGEPASPGPVAAPMPPASAAAAARSGVTGDLSVAITGGCVMLKDSQGKLWLKFGLALNWLGTTGFPPTTYEIVSEGKPVSTTPVKAAGGRVVSLSGEPSAFLGRQVSVTATIDPQRQVAEVDERNNSTTVTMTVPATAPTDTTERSVPCTNG